MDRKTYYDAEPWYQREKTIDWYQQMERSNTAIKAMLAETLGTHSVVTEVACGGGWLAEFISTLKPRRYHGFDFAETAVNNAVNRMQRSKDFTFFKGDALSVAAYSSDTNLILAHQFLHCLIGEDRARWMEICKNVLLPNAGTLLLSSMIGVPESVRDSLDEKTRINRPGNRYYAADEEIQEELSSKGFKIIEKISPEPHVAIYKAIL